MQSDFQQFATRIVAENPALGAAAVLGQGVVLSGPQLWQLLEKAHRDGVIDHSQVQKDLVALAREESNRDGGEQVTGPAAVKDYFDRIFGG